MQYSTDLTHDWLISNIYPSLEQTEAVKNLLYNPHLRKLLSEIDTSYNPGRAIQAAMMEPLFLEFANECLKVIDPGSDAEEDVLGI